MVNPVAEERSTSSDHVLAATGDAFADPVAKAIEAVGRRVLRRGEHDQHSVPIAVAALAPASAEDAFAVLPQDLEATIPISAEPKGWVHLPDAPRQAGGRHWAEKALQ